MGLAGRGVEPLIFGPVCFTGDGGVLRKAFLGAPAECDETVATINVEIETAGQYLALVRYEAAYRFETQFRLKIEQGGRVVLAWRTVRFAARRARRRRSCDLDARLRRTSKPRSTDAR